MTSGVYGGSLWAGESLSRKTETLMFDARSILDILIGGSPRGQRQPTDPSVFKDMLDQLGDQATPPAPSRSTKSDNSPQTMPGGHWTEQRYPEGVQPGGGPGAGTGLEDLLRGILT